jgi:N-ethylmaleimide reductase
MTPPDPVPLLRPTFLGNLILPHRVVMAPMTRNRAGPGHAPREMNTLYYRQRASAALILTEATPVEPRGHGYPHVPGMYSSRQELGWRRVVDAVHEEGGRIFQQLWHAGRIGHPLNLPEEADETVAPSPVRPEGEIQTPEGPRPFPEPRALDADEVTALVGRFLSAARRARRAGFDGVELHGANGYLVDQFLRDGTNRRRDRYGGDVEGRARFLVEATGALVDVWGADRVGVRLSPLNPFNDMEDSDPERIFVHAAGRLGELGIGYLHVVEPEPADERPDGIEHTVVTRMRDAFGGTVMLNGGYDRETGNRAVAEGRADLVSYGRLFLANPDLPRRFAEALPLNEPDPDTFYGGGAEGYVDYPTWEEGAGASGRTPGA